MELLAAIWFQSNQLLVGMVLLLTISNVALRALAWKYVVHPIKQVRFLPVFSCYLIGAFTSIVLPFKAGDVAQSCFLGNREDISKISLFSTVVVLRIFQFVTLITLMVTFTLFSVNHPFKKNYAVCILLAVLLLVLLHIVRSKGNTLAKSLEHVLGRFSKTYSRKISCFYKHFIDGTVALKSRVMVCIVAALSLCSWGIEILMIRTTAHALDIPLSLFASGIVLLAINLGLILSPVPGHIGTYQFLCIVAMSWFNVPKTNALGFSILYQLIQGIPVLFGGIAFSVQRMAQGYHKRSDMRTKKLER